MSKKRNMNILSRIELRRQRALLLLIFLAVSNIEAGDWPQWGGTNQRNMVSAEKGLPDTFDPGSPDIAEHNMKWVAKLGSHTFGNPTISGGKVFVGTNSKYENPKYSGKRGYLLCFDEATGQLIWQLSVPDLIPNKNLARHQDLGICSSATVEGDRVYVTTNRCEVLCLSLSGLAHGNEGPFKDEAQYYAGPGNEPVQLDATDADIIWRFDVEAELGIAVHDAFANAPLIVGDLLYVASGNGVNQSHHMSDTPQAPSLIALDKKTGKLVGVDDEQMGTRVFHGDWCSPSVGMVNGKPQILFGGNDGYCYAFDPTPVPELGKKVAVLKKIWSYDANEGNREKYRTPNGPSEVLGTPVCVNNRVYVTTGQDWTHGKGNGLLSCIDATKTGDISQTGKRWSYDKINRSVATVAVADGLVYATDIAGAVHCLDAATGKSYWVFDCKQAFWQSPLVADGKVYVGTSMGKFFILAAGKELKILHETNLGHPMCGAPVAANGVLYVATYTDLYAIGVKQ
jgi:outer membrane protein assembly factor BamB